MTIEEIIEHDRKLKAIGYPYDGWVRPDGSWNIPTVDESIYWDYAAGLITLTEAADEFNRCGWTGTRDMDYTKRKLKEIDNKYHKLTKEQL